MEHSARSRSVSYRGTSDKIAEVMVEGYNEARGQWIGRTSQNKTLNFTALMANATYRQIGQLRCRCR